MVTEGPRYRAFLSYNHEADHWVAEPLRHALQQFAKPFYARRAIDVFRDKDDLSANPALWPRIEQSLRDSEYFLLLASTGAARSRWVKREMDCWLRLHGG